MTGEEQHFDIIHELHQQYGDFVRTGPRSLSINHVEAIAPIYGPSPKCGKSVMYDQNIADSMQQERNVEKHQIRRKRFDKALGPAACTGYAPKLEHFANMLITKLKAFEGNPVVVNDWIHFFTFDVMGDIAFSTSFGQMESQKVHPAIDLIASFLKFSQIGQNIPWFTNLVSRLPKAQDVLKPFLNFSEAALRAREKIKPTLPDMMTHILDSKDGMKLSDPEMIGDSMLLLIGGSDTSYSSIVHLLFYLARYDTIQARLRAEVEAVLPSYDAPLAWPALSKLPLLSAVINETLRLHPPIASAQTRDTGAEGIVVDGVFIPPFTTVGIHTFTIQRDEKYFPQGDEWIPDRWLDSDSPGSQSHLIKDKRAFIPFSMGPFSCAGKYLALMEQKILIAKLVVAFNIQLAPGEDGYKLFHNYRDYITLWLDEVKLCFN